MCLVTRNADDFQGIPGLDIDTLPDLPQ